MNFLTQITAIVVVVFMFSSCDDDFNSVGGEVIGDVNFNNEILTITPVAYSKLFDKVQTNNLPANLIGIYNDPSYGQTVYDVLSQIQPAPTSFDPVFGENAVLDSVVLSLPYFSRATETEDVEVIINSNGETGTERRTKYELDSVYNGAQPIRLSIYKSNYFLSDFDPGGEERRIYYSDDVASFGPEIEGTLLYSNDNFKPSEEEVVTQTEERNEDTGVTTFSRQRVSPRLRVAFKDSNPVKQLFQELILDKQGTAELSNANNFLNFFRGIYFKAEPINNLGNLVMLDLSQANITLYYTAERADLQDQNGNGDLTELIEIKDTYELNFANNIVNSFQNNFTIDIPDPNTEIGDENLYLKGGQGSYAVIELFGKDQDNNGVADQLESFRENDWLINEASLKFYINQDLVTSGATEPERIYLFNVETGAVLIDYIADGTTNENSPVNSKINHLGRISRDADENGEFYKIRITQHVTDLLNENTDNITLGLAVSQNVNIVITGSASTPSNENTDETIPFSSIIAHEGTVFHGNGNNVPDSKRLKLEIFYTESTN